MNINNDDVLRFTTDAYPMTHGITTSIVSEVIDAINKQLEANNNSWASEGAECEYLSAQGGGWKKGRVHIRLEFVPDEDAQQKEQGQIISSELNKIRDSL